MSKAEPRENGHLKNLCQSVKQEGRIKFKVLILLKTIFTDRCFQEDEYKCFCFALIWITLLARLITIDIKRTERKTGKKH